MKTASVGIVVVPVQSLVSGVNLIKLYPIIALGPEGKVISSVFNIDHSLSYLFGGSQWTAENYIEAHKKVVKSGLHNFEGCKIPIPTSIRYDRLRDVLGENITPKEERVLSLIKYGMPLDCKNDYGVKEPQDNHRSALSFPKAIENYLGKNGESHMVLGPFCMSPILDLRYSPLMTVPKEETERRVIVDFSFPAGISINDGIPKATYLDHNVEFSLPSVQSMVGRVNALGKGCLLYKRDLKSAFRQFSTDPGDYKYTGMSWKGKIYIDTRLAMGLRSSAYCC